MTALPSDGPVHGLELIDVRHLGREHVICCAAIDDVIVDPGPESSCATLLESLGGRVPRSILLTHIHLDHAGAAGALVRQWPEVEVWVHERGARHLADPSKLIASAERLYGDDMQRLWGEIVAVPHGNLRILRGGEEIGPWQVAYTPGHAQHHVAYLHRPSATAFCGDVAGVRIDDGPILPPTPPPDIDLDAWGASIDLIEGWAPKRLAITHFGAVDEPAPHLDALRATLTRFGALSRELDAGDYEAMVREEIASKSRGEEAAAALVQALPPETQWAGLDRYWQRREQASGPEAGGAAR